MKNKYNTSSSFFLPLQKQYPQERSQLEARISATRILTKPIIPIIYNLILKEIQR